MGSQVFNLFLLALALVIISNLIAHLVEWVQRNLSSQAKIQYWWQHAFLSIRIYSILILLVSNSPMQHKEILCICYDIYTPLIREKSLTVSFFTLHKGQLLLDKDNQRKAKCSETVIPSNLLAILSLLLEDPSIYRNIILINALC